MLSAILPQAIGARVQIPSGNYAIKRAIEAYSFFPERDDGRTLTMRRIASDRALFAAQEERAQHTPAFVAQVRAVLRVCTD
jgi:hypothetical protein